MIWRSPDSQRFFIIYVENEYDEAYVGIGFETIEMSKAF